MAVIPVEIVEGFKLGGQPEIDLEAFAEALFKKTCDAIRNGTELSLPDRNAFEAEAANFAHSLKAIKEIADKRLRHAALDAAIAALTFGFYHAGNEGVLREHRDQFNKDRTRAALAARKKDDFQEIVAREANALWARKPLFKRTAAGTAATICDRVAEAIAALPKRSKGLKIPNLSDFEEKRKFIETIRKRVSRLKLDGRLSIIQEN